MFPFKKKSDSTRTLLNQINNPRRIKQGFCRKHAASAF